MEYLTQPFFCLANFSLSEPSSTLKRSFQIFFIHHDNSLPIFFKIPESLQFYKKHQG